VPAHNGTKVLPQSLAALAASDLPRACWELIVVDDASSDATAELAASYADLVVRLAGAPHGPAYARNRGAEVARGDVVAFIDADVVVHPDTLRRLAWQCANDPKLGAVFGSYDDRPPSRGLVSQYRNLLHHYHHQESPGEAETFWAGCGAVRATVFRDRHLRDWPYPALPHVTRTPPTAADPPPRDSVHPSQALDPVQCAAHRSAGPQDPMDATPAPGGKLGQRTC
jgi:glycosyltransferase involved in cell wall biosynthesis